MCINDFDIKEIYIKSKQTNPNTVQMIQDISTCPEDSISESNVYSPLMFYISTEFSHTRHYFKQQAVLREKKGFLILHIYLYSYIFDGHRIFHMICVLMKYLKHSCYY